MATPKGDSTTSDLSEAHELLQKRASTVLSGSTAVDLPRLIFVTIAVFAPVV